MTSAERSNNFDFLRLLLAALVIVSHSWALVSGDPNTEPLAGWLHGKTLGDVAVTGFFLISGYLIAKSYSTSSSLASYLSKRVRRIYPGYLAAFAICLLVVAPSTGGRLPSTFGDILGEIGAALGLVGPLADGFTTLPYHTLDGSMWTLGYEFRCYLALIAIGWLGLLRRPSALLALIVLLFALPLLHVPMPVPGKIERVVGIPALQMELLATFLTGSAFYLLRDKIRLSPLGAGVATLGLIICIAAGSALDVGLTAFGGYLLFWLALNVDGRWLSRINHPHDISYGVYLYAWPIAQLLLYFGFWRDPALLTLVTLSLSLGAGWCSWQLVERRAIKTRRSTLVSSTMEANATFGLDIPAAKSSAE